MKFKIQKLIVFLLSAVWAWQLSANDNFIWSKEGNKIILQVAENCYVYADSVAIDCFGEDNGKLNLISPKATEYKDEFLGKTQIYGVGSHVWQAQLPIKGAVIDFQGCQAPTKEENGVCFLPETCKLGVVEKSEFLHSESIEKSDFEVNLFKDFVVVNSFEGEMSKEEFIAFLQLAQEEVKIDENLPIKKGFFLVAILSFLGGILLNFTPCILPLIPINLSIIGAAGNKKQGVKRGLLYGLAMMIVYGVLGLLVIFGGARFGTLNSSSIFNFVIALIFLFLALAMVDVFHLDLSRYQSSIRFDRWKNSQNILAFFMGGTAALLAGACVAPVVIAMLLASSSMYNNSEYSGLLLPFIFGAGMALPWPIAGWTLGILPKPGKWMVYIKYGFAAFIFGMAVYYAGIGIRLLPSEFDGAKEVEKLEAALVRAEENNKLVLIDFWASWCKNCSSMKRNVLQDRKVKDILAEYYEFIEFQAEKFDDENIKEVLGYFDIKGLPAFVILRKSEE